MKFFAVATALSAITAASAANFTVQVGANGTLTYNPTSVNASEGDTIAFQFLAKNHTVTQSTFASPCNQSGVDSGFFPVQANATEIPQWSFTVNNASAPLWFFCRQTGHCEAGMVFAINPTAQKSFAAFQAAAMATTSNTTTGSTASASAGSSGAGSTASASVSSGGAASTSSTASSAFSRWNFNNAASALAAIGLLAGCLM